MSFTLFLGAALVLLPLFIRHSNLGDLQYIQSTFFIFVTMVGCIFYGVKKEKLTRIKGELGCFVALVCLAYFNQYDTLSLNVFLQANLFMMAIVFLMVVYTNEIKKDVIFNVIAVAGLLQCCFVIINYLGYDVHEWWMLTMYEVKKMYVYGGNITEHTRDLQKMTGTLGNPAHSSCFIAATSFFLLRKRWIYLLPLSVIGLFVTTSTMATLGAIGGLLIYLVIRFIKRKYWGYIWALVLAIGTPFCYYAVSMSTVQGSVFFASQRFRVWEKAVDWVGFTFFGAGLGFFGDGFRLFKGFEPEIYDKLHNEYLELYVAFGVLGVIILLFLFYRLYNYSKDPILYGALGAILINAFGNFPLHIPSTALLTITIYALILQGGVKNEKDFCINGHDRKLKRLRRNFLHTKRSLCNGKCSRRYL